MLNDIYQSIDPVLFAFGPFTVRWYGVAYVLGFVFAGLVIWRVARRWRVRVDGWVTCCSTARGTISSIPSRSSRSTKAV